MKTPHSSLSMSNDCLTDATIAIVDGGLANDARQPLDYCVANGCTGGCEMNGAVSFGRLSETTLKASQRASSNDNRSSADRLDQYYTRLDLAAYFYARLREFVDLTFFLLVEPSAGDGAFFRLMPDGSIGVDVEPQHPGIRTADFLKITIGGGRPICVLGNPPFGKNSNLAIKFFNHAAREAKIIAMILPSTFLKGSTQNKLDPAFHVIYQETVPDNAFRFEGRLCSVPATFMIWERRPEPRKGWPTDTRHPDFEFLPNCEGAEFMIKRVGAQAGRVHDDKKMSESSHYFIRSIRRDVRATMEQLGSDFARIAGYVAGNPSLAKSEIVSLYLEKIERTSSG